MQPMRVEKLSRANKEEVVAVLCQAFHDYPVMRFVLKSSGNNYDKDLTALIGFFCESRLIRNFPVLGIRDENGWLIGAALANDAVRHPLPLPEEPLQQLRKSIGKEAFARLVAYEDQSSKGEPTTMHHFLGMIGILPSYQGKGYAKHLMDAVKEIALANPESTGICLSTELPENVPMYERFGYRVISEADVGELHCWCMFLLLK
jgi:GNAT superfamily N-acetyltransferase